MSWLRDDLKQAWRALIRRPGFSGLAILALAVGLGVNTVAFSAVNALLYKPFRFPNAEAAGWLFVGTRRDSTQTSSLRTFEAIRTNAKTLEFVSAEGRVPLVYRHGGGSEEIWSLVVSDHYFSIVAVRPVLGRTLTAGDGARGDTPILVSERFWRRRLGSETDLSRLAIDINGQTSPVIGVLPDDFQGPSGVFEPDVWVLLESARALNLAARDADADGRWLSFLARPAPGQTAESVQAEIAGLTTGTSEIAPGDELRVRYERFIDLHPEARGLAPIAWIGLIAVGSVLLIACFNVAGLMLARSFERRRDIAVRAALGASPWRLARALLTEGLLFAVVAGAAALLLAYWSAFLLSAFSLPAPIPQRLHFVTDWRLVGFAVLASALAALIPSLAPMWQVARADLTQWSRAGHTAGGAGVGQRRTRRVFVLLQVAGSTLFLTTALMTATAFRGAWHLDPGFDVNRTAVLIVSPTSFGATPAVALETMRAVAARVASAPGVEAVTVTDRAPYQIGVNRQTLVSADGRDCASGGCTPMTITRIDRGYFSTSTRRVISGTASDADDAAAAVAVVINQAAADRLWPGGTPVGQSFRGDGVWREVRGVVTNAEPAQNVTESPTAFLPFERGGASGALAVIARGRGDARALLAPLRDALRRVDAALPIQSLQTMDERMALPLWMPRTILGFFTACATLAVLLSTVGLFGVTYFAVNQRRHEFGVRSALGASIADVRRLVLGETIRLAAPGVALGLVAAFGTVLIARATLPSVPALGLAPYGLAMVIQVLVALAAGWEPARRAAKAQPVEVLRE